MEAAPAALLDKLEAALNTLPAESRPFVMLPSVAGIVAFAAMVGLDGPAQLVTSIGALALFATGMWLLARQRESAIVEEGTGASRADILRAFDSVNGPWLQLTLSDEQPGVSLLRLTLSPSATGHSISGRKWNPSGQFVARFHIEAVAVRRIDPVTLFYYWEGAYPDRIGEVSGVGTMIFNAACTEGDGWFTTGRADEGDFARMTKVVMRRPAPDELEMLESGDADARARVRELHQTWFRAVTGRAPRVRVD